MPIYEYECGECRHRLEALQKISDAPLVECPACGKSSLRKLVSAAGFRLKGGGWYETDFKTGNKQNLAESESTAKSGGDKAKGGEGDKPKPAAESKTEKAVKESKPATDKTPASKPSNPSA